MTNETDDDLSQPWWHEGVHFECQQSSRCCRVRDHYGYVYVSLEDRRRLAAHFGLKTSQFTRRYCRKARGLWHLKDPDKDCAFLEGCGCSIYEARPTQCRTWPFWPENMAPDVWKNEVANFCPGVGKGKLYAKEEIVQILSLQKEAEES